jgi:thiaminase
LLPDAYALKGHAAEAPLDAASGIPAGDIIAWLRNQSFNRDTQQALLHHPLVLAAENGSIPIEAVKLVLFEEYSIEKSDLRSMAAALARFGSRNASRDFFLTSVDGENIALQDLVAMAKVLGISEAELAAYQPEPGAHAYSAYLAQLSNYEGAARIAAGFAVNFPTWGKMCGHIRDALLKPPYSRSHQDVAFFTYFADPIPDYDSLATRVIAEGMAAGETAHGIRSSVMLLQGYELMFWDTVWRKAIEK